MKHIFKIALFLLVLSTCIQGCSVQNVKEESRVTKDVTPDTLVIKWKDDELANALTLVNGILMYKGEPFTGEVVSLFEGGDTSSVASYISGRENGWSVKWYSNGNKMEERFYENGRKEGTHKAWYEDGSPRFVYNFVNNEYEGNLKEWYPNGQMYKDFHYINGYEAGMQTAWETNGKLLANYDVKNGRKYGLIGTHNCKSLWDSEGESYERSM